MSIHIDHASEARGMIITDIGMMAWMALSDEARAKMVSEHIHDDELDPLIVGKA